MGILTHKQDGMFGIKIPKHNIDSTYARVADLISAMENCCVNAGLIETVSALVSGTEPCTQVGETEFTVTANGANIAIKNGDRAGSLRDALILAVVTGVIKRSWVVEISADGLTLSAINPSTMPESNWADQDYLKQQVDWPMRLTD
jgi:hypothetical protein